MAEALLLGDKLHISSFAFMRDLTYGLNRARKALLFVAESVVLPSGLSMEQFLLLFQGHTTLQPN